MSKSPSQWLTLVQNRAIRLARIHLAGRMPVASAKRRAELHAMHNAALGRLASAVEAYDKACERADAALAEWKAEHYRRRQAAKKAWRTRRARAVDRTSTRPLLVAGEG